MLMIEELQDEINRQKEDQCIVTCSANLHANGALVFLLIAYAITILQYIFKLADNVQQPKLFSRIII